MKIILFIIKYVDNNNKICYLKDVISDSTKKCIEEYINFCRKHIDKYVTIKEIIGIRYKIVGETYNENEFIYANEYEDLKLD